MRKPDTAAIFFLSLGFIVTLLIIAVLAAFFIPLAEGATTVKRTVVCDRPTTRVDGSPLPLAEIKSIVFYEVLSNGQAKQIQNSGKQCKGTVSLVLGTEKKIAVRTIDTSGSKSPLSPSTKVR